MTRQRPTRLVLLGSPVTHSLSPLLQNAALGAAGIPLTYEAIDVSREALPSALGQLVREGGAGNVTIPHKMAVGAKCHWRSAVAERAGAVNTFWVDSGRLYGDNTDVAGFDAAVAALGTPREGAVVALAGAGGAASAVCVATSAWPGARVVLSVRRPEQGWELARRFPHVSVGDPNRWAADATLVVHATPVGLHGDELPLAEAPLPDDADVMDLVYRPGETPFVHWARALGHRAIDGQEMLLQQGAAAFERWFDVTPDRGAMRAALSGIGE